MRPCILETIYSNFWKVTVLVLTPSQIDSLRKALTEWA